MSQLNLFTNITCDRCGENPGTKPGSPSIWNGFYDSHVDKYVCWKCQSKHYQLKAVEENFQNGGMIYHEMPVPIR